MGPLAGMWMHVKCLFSFRTDIPCCAFPGFGLFLLFTLCCHGDGEITDVKSWDLGPQETFIIVLCMKRALVPWFCRAECLFYKEVTNEESSLMNNVKLSFSPTAQEWVILLWDSKVGSWKPRDEQLSVNFSLGGKRMMHQNKGLIHHSFPALLKKIDFPNLLQPCSARKPKTQGTHQDAAISSDECLQNICEQSVSLNKTKYGGKCLQGYGLKPHSLVTT